MTDKTRNTPHVVHTGLGAPPEKPVVGQKTGSAKAQRTAARLAAVQVLYQMRLNNQDAETAVAEFVKHRVGFNLDGDVFVPADPALLEKIVYGVQERWIDIEDILAAALDKKTDPEAVLGSVLRAGVFELMADRQTDTGIIIHDYLNVTTGFYDGTEPKLVNAVLDRVAKTVRA